jgi:hypothetical protein
LPFSSNHPVELAEMPDQKPVVDPEPANVAVIARVGVQGLSLSHLPAYAP